jgi:type VI secretion system protein ImpA
MRDDLLTPIPGANPAGVNLRYAPVYDKIKEARREDDDAPQGEWRRERKTADYALVAKLAGEALATGSKDLQLAAWLTEAALRREGFAGLRAGLDLIRNLIEDFWDGLYPEIEDGDAEMRAAPLDWLGSRLDATLRSQPIARGASWLQLREARAVGLEADADTDAKQEARAAAIADGKMTGEDWEQAFAATPKAFYAALEATLDGVLESTEALSATCEEKFGDDAPSFGPMRATVEEIRHTVHGLLQKKREAEPDVEEAPTEEDAPAAGTEEPAIEETAAWETPRPTPMPARPKVATLSAEPVDREDALRRVAAVAVYLRREDPYSPIPYLLLRGVRFGELRAAGADLDLALLEPPPTEVRQQLRKAAAEYEWQQALDGAEAAMAAPCGRGWLDLQRYAYRAAYELGYYQPQAAIRAEVNALLADYPALRDAVLLDDTPAANPETKAWLEEIAPAAPAAPEPAVYAPPVETAPAAGERNPDVFDLARQAAAEGRGQEGVEMLTRAAAAETSGRGRFERRLQLAQLCMGIGYERIAQPILEQLAAEIDERELEGWESSSAIAQPLALLYRCLARTDAASETKQKIYERICRLDPLQALACGR